MMIMIVLTVMMVMTVLIDYSERSQSALLKPSEVVDSRLGTFLGKIFLNELIGPTGLLLKDSSQGKIVIQHDI